MISSSGWKIHDIAIVAYISCGSLDIPEKDAIKAALQRAISPNVFHGNHAEESKEIIRKELLFLSEKYDEEQKKLFNYRQLPSLSNLRLRLFEGLMHGAVTTYNSVEAMKLSTRLESLLSDGHEIAEDLEEENVLSSIHSSLQALYAVCEEPIPNESDEISKLSLASQRCLLVLKDLMNHPQSMPFNLPVEVTVSADYYKRIKNPLSFSDIRRHLTLGRYGNEFPITKFYLDVNLVIENALAFNSEISAIGQAASKISMIFERLFHEMILNWETPLPSNDCCHMCRSEEADSSRTIICDRCEATYHVHCLEDNSRGVLDKKGEWYCTACIEQYSVASTHHYRSSQVEHPLSKSTGEVVGLDQVDLSLRFVVLFKDGSRECWDVDKVRKYRIHDENEMESSIIFPSGYVEDDINLVSSVARGYQNWGSLLIPTPTFIDEHHIIPANNSDSKNQLYSRWQRVVGALGPLSEPQELCGSDWLQILMALSRRNLGSPASLLAPAIASLDVDTTYISFESKGDALQDIAIKPSVQIGEELLFFGENIAADYENQFEEQIPVDEALVDEDAENRPPDSNTNESDAEIVPNPSRTEEDSSDDLFSDNGTVSVGEERSSSSSSSDEESLFEESFHPGKQITEPIEALDPLEVWDDRRNSRVKGREDALLTLCLIHEVTSIAGLFGEGNNEEVPDTGVNFGAIAFQTAVRACAPRSVDAVDFDEWQRGFEIKLNNTVESKACCHFCGMNTVCGTFDQFIYV